jgi:Flp pilus assembly protein TadD
LEDAYYYRAISYEMLDQYQNAFNDYNKAVLLDPDDAYNYNGRGNAYSNLGQTANANANKTRACSLDSQWC